MYAKLFSSLYQGTLRGCSDEILVFTNLLAHADSTGLVDKHWRAISEETGISEERVKTAIANLEAPDPESRSPEEGGRRIIPIDEHRAWGWQVVNHGKYRSIRSEEDRREQNRLAQQKWREKKKAEKEERNDDISKISRVSRDKPKQKQEAYTEEKEEEEGNEIKTDAKDDLPKNPSSDLGESRPLPSAPNLEIFIGTVTAGLCARMKVKTVPAQWEWHKELTWAFQNGFTVEHVLGCYDALKKDKFWLGKAVPAKTLIKNLSEYKKPQDAPKRPTARQMQAELDQ